MRSYAAFVCAAVRYAAVMLKIVSPAYSVFRTAPIMIVYPAVSPGARILSLKWSPPTASHPAYALPAGTPARFLTTAFGRSKLPPSPIKSCTVG